ncbi:MAG: Beta-lactamase protein [Candidatus Poribacteria bacterium]|nr:Beta-lactamase protein [Candidatus Poribacteria bacterium]
MLITGENPHKSDPKDINSNGLDSKWLDRAYRVLEEAARSGKIPGAAILVARHGIPMEPRCFGRMRPETDSSPIQSDTIFLVASVTKPVTVAATMLLVEKGKISLDDTVVSIIPEFGNRGKDQIRIRHLMTHTSGLPDMIPENQKLREKQAPLKEFIRLICDITPDFPPGTNIQYQSSGIAILGEIVERIEDISLPEFLHREIFQPLGMKDTALGAHGIETDRIAYVNTADMEMGGVKMQNTDWDWNKPYWRNFGAPWGGMFTTVADMFRFCQMFLNGGEFNGARVLKSETVKAMAIEQTNSMEAIPVSAKQQVWGLGWQLQPDFGFPYFGDLVSPGSYGHSGATGTMVWVDPVNELICVLFTTEPYFIWRHCSSLVAASVK